MLHGIVYDYYVLTNKLLTEEQCEHINAIRSDEDLLKIRKTKEAEEILIRHGVLEA